MKKADYIIIAIVLLIGIAGAIYLNVRQFDTGDTVSIYVDGNLYKKLDLSVNQTVEVETEYGHNTVVIEDGIVFMSDADCHDLLCTHMAPIEHSGANIVCLPHHLHIEVDTDEEVEIDAISN